MVDFCDPSNNNQFGCIRVEKIRQCLRRAERHDRVLPTDVRRRYGRDFETRSEGTHYSAGPVQEETGEAAFEYTRKSEIVEACFHQENTGTNADGDERDSAISAEAGDSRTAGDDGGSSKALR